MENIGLILKNARENKDYTQKKVMEHLDRMMNHENWVKAKDWRSL